MTPLMSVHHDERTVAIENTSYRWSYLFLSFGVLAATAYRGFVKGESAWDLLLLVILAGAVGTIYQARNKVLSRHWLRAVLVTSAIAGAVALTLVWLR